MKISPVINGFIDYLSGSPAASQTGAQFFRYDSTTTEVDIANAIAGDIGFCYVVQFGQMLFDQASSPMQGTTRYEVAVICMHGGTDTAVLNPLEATEIVSDLFFGSFTDDEGVEIGVYAAANPVELLVDEMIIAHSINFVLIRNTLT